VGIFEKPYAESNGTFIGRSTASLEPIKQVSFVNETMLNHANDAPAL
jgi:hypothetical protein